MRPVKPVRSDLGWSTETEISVYGLDLVHDVLGRLDLGGIAFLGLTRRLPSPSEQRMFNALLVTLVEHGITPNALAARLTYLGAPEALQGAVAAGLLGLGSVLVGTIEGSARMLQEATARSQTDTDVAALARDIVAEHRAQKAPIPGLGHPKHRPIDPRARRLFELAREENVYGTHCALMEAVAREAARVWAPRELPLNATGAIGAIASDLGFPWSITRGFGVIGRSVGLVAHLLEESQQPMAREIWERIDAEVTEAAIGAPQR
jgi:citrate synthase